MVSDANLDGSEAGGDGSPDDGGNANPGDSGDDATASDSGPDTIIPDAQQARTVCDPSDDSAACGQAVSDDACPATEPTVGAACGDKTLACYYCPLTDHASDALPTVDCHNGKWKRSTVACTR